MKIFAWILCVLSSIACLGLLGDLASDSDAMYGIVYAGAVVIFTGIYIKEANEKIKA